MVPPVGEPDYQLVWPRTLFTAESARLLNQRKARDWEERCELLLEDAFAGDDNAGPLRDFRDVAGQATADPWSSTSPASALTPQQLYLRDLMVQADKLHEDSSHRRPYWRERHAGPREREALSIAVVVRNVVDLIKQLERSGYFERRFGKDCVDDPYDDTPERLLERELGVAVAWPLNVSDMVADHNLFYDVLEFLHDIAARPKWRYVHNYGGCGWHHKDFDVSSGRIVYRWRINKILEQSVLDLRLADDGEDIGRLVVVTDDARSQLVEVVATRRERDADDQVRHALALFRARGADRHQKRSAIATLALVLEERRHNVLKEALASSDSGALFEIANKFHVRHQDAKQKRDYDEFYLDWIFWVYLSTIEMTNRIINEQQIVDSAGDMIEPPF